MFSPDTEYIPFITSCVTDGRPEEWLNKVEASMYATTKKSLYKTLEDAKGKKEKWVKDYPGQMIISAGQMKNQSETVLLDTLKKCFEKFCDAALEFRRKECVELVATPYLSCVFGIMNMFDALATPEQGCSAAEGENFIPMIEMYFLFGLIWSIGATVDEAGRKKFDMFLREMDGRFPSNETVFEYWVCPKRKTWAPWEEKLNANFKVSPDTPFFKIMVPTVDTVRTKFVLQQRIKIFQHCMVTGGVGVGKTLVAMEVLSQLPESKSFMVINMSAQSSSNSLQETIEGKLEKRTKGVFAPTGGKKLVTYIDDFNMPKKSVFGFIPPLELLKLWADNGFWYDRAKQEVKNIKDMQLMVSMAPPGGGRNPFSQRVQACFRSVNMTTPNSAQLRRIFSTMLNGKLSEFDDEIKPLGDPLTQATAEVYQATRQFYDSKESMLQLWCHETFRIYGDRMWDHNDKDWLKNLLDEKLSSVFSSGWKTLFEDGEMPPYATFMRNVEHPPYEPILDQSLLKDFLMEKLEDYALEPGKAGGVRQEEKLGSDEVKTNVCKTFMGAHQSVAEKSELMKSRLKRINYVTATNYLEFVNGYRSLLSEKRSEIGDKAEKLRGGLEKLDETGVQVQEMQVVCQEKKVVVAKAKRDCEELLVEIVQDKRVADEQEKQVSTEAARIEKEAEETNAIAKECQEGLDRALPALQEAEDALNVLTKKDISELKAYAKPPALVELVLCGVMTVLKRPPTWDECKKQMGDASFLEKLTKFDKDLLQDGLLKKINKYTAQAEFKPDIIGKVSFAAKGLCMWVCAMETANQVNGEEWQFFLRGGQVLDKSTQPQNPGTNWISELSWDNITELENLPHFKGIVGSFEQGVAAWEEWYRANEPESAELPGEWESKCNELQRMVFVRCLRPDRVMFASTTYVANSLGRKFVEPPVLDLGETYSDSIPTTPLIFVLSPGVDPTSSLLQLATAKGLAEKFNTIALGQGQAPVATKLIDDGIKDGNWVFLANCHLMTSWLPTLDKAIESFAARNPHETFRLWLSSNPTPFFPLAILQRAIKMTTEPPKGLRANMARLYNTITEESFLECKTQSKYPKLLFALVFFHSVLLERKKFRTLGINIPYDFNDTDFAVSNDLLKSYLDEYEETPWDALKYLISEANYGGRVTDELDRRVLNSYLNQYYCEDALSVPNYGLSSLAVYYIPDNGPLQSYKDYVQTLPISDRPETFGQHPNADISYMIEDSKIMLDSILLLQPAKDTAAGGMKTEDIVNALCADLLAQVPFVYPLEDIMNAKADDPSALHVVLFQELERYNILLNRIRSQCAELQKGIKGLVVMSSDLDQIFDALANARIPPSWNKAYPSIKPLGAWTRDLLQRTVDLQQWVEVGYPKVYWLSGFTYPTGFLTAVLQTTARKNSIPIDTLAWEFSIINLDEKEITQPPKEGVYIKGMFLEGAGWDFENGCLMEPEPMELIVPMPIIHFKPVENKKKSQKGIYLCPLYLYPVRTGSRERPSFMISIDLKSGNVDPDHWVKRGTALLLALAV
eukprot:gene5380-6528_t